MIGTYEAYSGIEITKKLNQLVEYLSKGSEDKERIGKMFMKADTTKSGTLPLSKVY